MICESAGRRFQREYELIVANAWHTENFQRQKKLKALKHYLDKSKPRKAGPQSHSEMRAKLHAWLDAGREDKETG